MKQPPNDLPAYRALTGPDDAAFCQRVSEALALGYELYGSPAATFDGQRIVVAQAVIWPGTKHQLPGTSQGGA
ncbi:MAG: DUF1737 domain-containing protein [Lysobacter sp.]